MKYKITDDKIFVYDKSQFNPKHILECGQIFRYQKRDDGSFVVFSGNKIALISEQPDCYEISTSDAGYFEHFFDLKTDYQTIKNQLAINDTMQKAIDFGYGIRILNQQPLEMIISFIISANNNIKRIQVLVERLCEKCGTNMGEYFAFPTLEQLKTLSLQDLRDMGMGFRAKYIFNTTLALEDVDLQKLCELPTQKLLEFLTGLSGVGPKVADCIALFGYHKMDCFPVDTWIQKVYNCYFATNELTNRVLIRKKLVETFGNLSGYAQQYLFYFKRELDKVSKD